MEMMRMLRKEIIKIVYSRKFIEKRKYLVFISFYPLGTQLFDVGKCNSVVL